MLETGKYKLTRKETEKSEAIICTKAENERKLFPSFAYRIKSKKITVYDKLRLL
jgi:hypothetical protein